MVPSPMDLRLLGPGRGDLRGQLIKEHFAVMTVREAPQGLLTGLYLTLFTKVANGDIYKLYIY